MNNFARASIIAVVTLAGFAYSAPVMGQAAEETSRYHPYLTPVGDLDGDGGSDLIGLGWLPDSITRVAAYRGSDGAVLWTREEPGVVRIVPARVGPEGGTGVLIVSGGVPGAQTFFGSSGGQIQGPETRLRLVALSATGGEVWTREFVSESPALITTTHLDYGVDIPFYGGTLDAVPGPATDVLVLVHDYNPTQEGQRNHATVQVLDGTDGSIDSTFERDLVAAEAAVRPAPDLSGDGLDDVLFFEDSSAGADQMSALSGATGTSLWSNGQHQITVNQGFVPGSGPRVTQRVVFLGDASGDDISEVGRSEAGITRSSSSPTPGRSISVLDGATGATSFSETGDIVRAVGDLNGDGLAEVGVQTALASTTQAGAVYETYDGAGIIRRFREHLVQVPSDTSAVATLLPSVGDVDGDELDDAAHRVTLTAGTDTTQQDRVVSGKDYETLSSSPIPTSVRASIDGAGDDFVEVDPFGASVIDVIARDGRTGEELWQVRLRPRGQTTRSTIVQAVDVTGDGLAEVIVSAENAEPGTLPSNLGGDTVRVDAFVLSAIGGSTIWSSP